ncbi:MAG: glycosyltransferase [Kofleriaceae bacterium]
MSPGPTPLRALIVVPTYNERDNVAGVAAAFLAARAGVELLFVDDNSPDGTGAALDELASAEPRLHVLHRPGKLGPGTAYLDGFAWGLARGYDLLFEMDADGSHDPAHLPAMFALLEDPADPADVAVGSRWVEGGGTVNWGVGRRLLSRGGSLYAHHSRRRRPRSHLRVHRLEPARARGDRSVHGPLQRLQLPDRDEVPRAARGLRVRETPITFVDRRVGQSKMSRAIFAEALVMVWRLRLRPPGDGGPG